MTKDKEMEKFINDLSHNSPNSDMFENVKDFEEDACGGKTFETMRKENKKEEDK
jgi:hypothetical protein